MVVCRVILLDKDNYEAEIPKSAVGQQLFDKVKERLSLEEADFFGLSYHTPSGLRHWLNLTKRVDKQLDSNPWVFSFEVKFYPPEPNILSSDETRYLLVLQVRQDLLTGRLPCSFHTHALLGSYTIQSELGDYSTAEHGAGTGIDYLRPYIFAPNQSDELLYRIADLHRLHKGLHPEEADLLFLDSAKKLALYGVDLYKVKDVGHRDVLVGVSAAGLYIYEDRLRMDTFKWPRILKVSYKRNLFNVKVRSLEFDKEEHMHGFKCTSPKHAKRLWRITVETHQFFRLKQPELTDTVTLGFGTKRWRMSGRTLHEMTRPGSATGTLSKSMGPASRSTSRDTLSVRRATSITQLPAEVLARRKLVASSQVYVNETEQGEKVLEPGAKKGSGDQMELPPGGLASPGRSGSTMRRALNGSGGWSPTSPATPGANSRRVRCEPEEDDFEDAMEYNPASGELSDGRTTAVKNGDLKTSRAPGGSTTEAGSGTIAATPVAESAIVPDAMPKQEVSSKTMHGHAPTPQPRTRMSLTAPAAATAATTGRQGSSSSEEAGGGSSSSSRPARRGADVGAGAATAAASTAAAAVPAAAVPAAAGTAALGALPLPSFAPESLGATVSGSLDHVVADTSERGEKLIRIGLPPTVRTTSVRYNPNVESEVHTTRQVPIVRTLSRSQANGYGDDEFLEGQLLSSMSHSSQLQTTETTTYTTEKDGYIEKRMTTKITIVSENAEDIDYDKALLEAIQRVTNMDPNLAVEKIEIKTEDTP